MVGADPSLAGDQRVRVCRLIEQKKVRLMKCSRSFFRQMMFSIVIVSSLVPANAFAHFLFIRIGGQHWRRQRRGFARQDGRHGQQQLRRQAVGDRDVGLLFGRVRSGAGA